MFYMVHDYRGDVPQRPSRPCTAPGCPGLQPCQAHPRGTQHAYDRARGTAHSRGYDRRHQRMREQVLAEEPVCQACGVEASVIADHIVPVEHARAAGWSEQRTWSRGNYQALCHADHQRKTAVETLGDCPCAACRERRAA